MKNKTIIVIVITIIFVLLLYFLGFKKTSTSSMNLYTFNISTKYFMLIILGYVLVLFLALKK